MGLANEMGYKIEKNQIAYVCINQLLSTSSIDSDSVLLVEHNATCRGMGTLKTERANPAK